ncbi:hypothetical protein N7523_007940 [Penicillium sp. IBT 18751x]|nr:hypothetical protein N7523_007940 [Penicillium sp. IBT 18751x]
MTSRNNFHQFPSIFRECPVQVIVGPEKTPYYIHPGILSSCGSPVLKARIDGPWKTNGANKAIDWTEFDEDTIECAMSYLYVEDYGVCGPDNIGEQKEEENDKDRIDCQNWPFQGEVSSVSKSTMFDEAPAKRLLAPLSRRPQVDLPVETMQTAPAAFTNELHDCDERMGDMALIHAKVYCFAHLYLISKLEGLALQRLTQLLQVCEIPNSPFFMHLADAIRLVYGSTPKSEPKDPARGLLSQYVALKYTVLSDDDLNSLIAEGGDFMIDVSYKLGRRISMHGTSFEGQIDHLRMNIKRLEQKVKNHARCLRRAEEEIHEWESWNRGISQKLRKAKRVVAPYQFSGVQWSA